MGDHPITIHLDTDLGSDTDDACALAMLLGWPSVELTGVTTTIDPGGRRAGYVAHCLELAGRDSIPLAAGAEVSMTTLTTPGDIPDDERFWPVPVPARPDRPGAALDLLDSSIEQGATIVAIGPFTNLALLEVARPGRLARSPVVLMGGWLTPPDFGLPAWGPDMDWNVQCDTRAAELVVAGAGDLTIVSLAVTVKVHLREAALAPLADSGPLGSLLAHQARAHASAFALPELGRAHAALPDDLLNFQHDALACAVAAGWGGVETESCQVRAVLDDGVLRLARDPAGRTATVVVDVDAEAFEQLWLDRVSAAQRPG